LNNELLSDEFFRYEVKNITKSYEDAIILNDFKLSVSPGDFFVFLGDNGSGKTTAMRVLALVEKIDSGTIKVDGNNAYENIKDYRSQIGYIPQSIALFEDMTGYDNLMMFSNLKADKSKERISYLSNILEMNDFINKKVKKLSGGMKRRINIACGLVNNPKLVIADEPFASLDVKQRKVVTNLFNELSKRGVSFIVSTHYKENIESIDKDVKILEI